MHTSYTIIVSYRLLLVSSGGGGDNIVNSIGLVLSYTSILCVNSLYCNRKTVILEKNARGNSSYAERKINPYIAKAVNL